MQLIKLEDPTDKAILSAQTPMIEFPPSDELKKFITEFTDFFLENCAHGVGLAAPQVGKSLQLFIIRITPEAAALRENAKAYPLTVYINPRYQPVDENDRVADFEACYSVDAVSGSVPRYRKIKFNARTINGEPIELIAEDFLARVLQHETDHVHGLTIVDRLTPDCIQGSIDEMRERRYQQFSSVQKRIVDELKKE